MSDVHTWSQTAAANSSPPPDGAPENMLRPAVNDVIREVMASVRRWYHGEDWSRPHGAAVTSRDSSQVVRVAGADYTGSFFAGRRCRVSGGGTREGYVVSSVYSAPDTLVTVRLEPTSFAELAAGVNLTFADAGANDTITAAAGTPFSGVGAGDRVRVEKTQASHVNSGTKLVQSVGGGGSSLTLDAAESLTNEGPSAQKIYLEAVGVPVGTTLLELGRWATKSSAHREIGTGAGQIPTADRLGTAAFGFTGSGKGLDADTVDGQHATDLQAYARTVLPQRNRLVNGGFRRWQRGASFTAMGATTFYTADQWKAELQAANCCDVTKETSNLPTGARAAMKMAATATVGKFAAVQFVEAEDCLALINGTASLSVYLKASATIANARLIVLSWSGAEDAVGALISAWNAAGNNPTFAANVTVESSSQVALTTSWQRFKLENIAIDAAGSKNVGVFIMADDDAITAADAMWVALAQLEEGAYSLPVEHEQADQMMARTARFFSTTVVEGTAPAHGVGLTGALYNNSIGGAATDLVINWQTPVKMCAGGTHTFSMYNPVNAAPAGGRPWRDITGAVDRSATLITTRGDLNNAVQANEAVTSNRLHAIHLLHKTEIF